ncbi:hypothetical protein FLL57_03890 [Rhodopseudomonas palustris]|nr:hypothetical protein FLL57_03890 [Rhodopseudomonas palustris]
MIWRRSCPIRHGRARPGHPRPRAPCPKTWMPGTSPGMTSFLDGASEGDARAAQAATAGRPASAVARSASS